MGWLSLRSHLQGPTSFKPVPTQVTDFKSATEHVEHVQVESIGQIYEPTASEYKFQDPSVPDDALPWIPPAIVRSQRLRFSEAKGLAWIVVDNIVYDCTKFIKEHPGGETVIRSFIGEDCSWQFWRFHSEAIMVKWGGPLRVGRTEGIGNRFKEPPRYFGSRNR
jgi:cytochrome b involved in lipid metabolism